MWCSFTAPEALFPLCISVTIVRLPLGWTPALPRRPSPLRNAKKEVRRIFLLAKTRTGRSYILASCCTDQHTWSTSLPSWQRAVAQPWWLESPQGSVLVMPVTLQMPPSPAETDIFPNGSSDTCSAHRCGISQKAIFCGPLCVKISCEPHVFVTQQQKHKMLRSTLLERNAYYFSGNQHKQLSISSLLSLLLSNVFRTVNTHPLIKAWCLFSVWRYACCEAACQCIIPHCVCPIVLVVPQ